MPKSLITKNMNQRLIISSGTGHYKKENFNLIKNTTIATADIIISEFNKYQEPNSVYNGFESDCEINCNKLCISNINDLNNCESKNIKKIINEIDFINSNSNCEIHDEIKNSVVSIVNNNCINKNKCNIEDLKEKELWNDYINPFLSIGPYKIPSLNQFTEFINLLTDKMNNISSEECPRLFIYKGILEILVKGRSMYFYDLELESTNSNLRNKITELNSTVLKYSTELALSNGNENGLALAGNLGIKLNKPKNLIYAQAILNINQAWYIYLYNTKKIEYDKYQGVTQYIKDKGKQVAYNELITLLDEKYKDIEDEIHDNINCGNNNSNDSCDSKSTSSEESNNCNYEDNYCSNNGTRALVLGGSLSITISEKFAGNITPGFNHLLHRHALIFRRKTKKKKKSNSSKSCKNSSSSSSSKTNSSCENDY